MKVNKLNYSHDSMYKTHSPGKLQSKAEEKKVSTEKCTMDGNVSDKAEISHSKKIFAASGNDVLEVRQTRSENVYKVRFEHSALVHRAVSRGYITVNGKTVCLTDEVKSILLRTEKKADNLRDNAYAEYVNSYNAAIGNRDAKVLTDFQKKLGRVLETANKYAKGERVRPSELKELMETCPELYKMAMVMRMMEKDRDDRPKPDKKEDTENEEEIESVSWDDFDWKGYETEIEVDLSGDEPVIGEISVSEKNLTV